MFRRQAFLTLLGAAAAAGQSAKTLTQEELTKLLEKQENLFFLDVREPDEIKQLGSISGYVNIPVGQLQARLSEVPKNKLIITA
jgi:rhodanese-related sulfurtransferase